MKALKIAGVVVAAVALVASAVVTGGATLGIAASTIATATTVATYASLAAGVLGVVGALAGQPKFNQQGTATKFATNPQSGLPYAIGRTRMSGLRVFAETNNTPGYTKAEDLLWFVAMLSAGGAIHSIESFRADGAAYSFNSAGQTTGEYANFMAQKVHLGGAQASGLATTLNGGSPPGWTSAHRLSGISHALWGLRFDKDGKLYSAGVPEPAWVGKWVKVYDPRKDSTYPGGSGSHRANNESTYEWSENGPLQALTWVLGRWQNGKRTLGIGAPVANIRVADFVEAANVADANGWTCGGVEWSTDSKKDILKRMLQSAGAEMTMTGAMIGCRVNAPRIPIATITAAHLLDRLSIATTKPRQQRFNTAIPRFRDEDSEWEVVSGTPVSISSYVTADGGRRTKEIDLALVQKASGGTAQQAAQLVAYEIVNSREAGPISFTTGPEWLGLKTGDCVILDVPDEGLDAQPILIREVSLDPASTKVTFTAETETEGKHPFALGATTTPPPPFSLTPPDLTPPAPDADLWTVTPTSTGIGYPSILVAGVSELPGADAVLMRYRIVGAPLWQDLGKLATDGTIRQLISPVAAGTAYEIEVAYQVEERVGPYTLLGPVTTGVDGLGVLIANAQATADSARGVFWQESAPTAAESVENDMWIKKSTGVTYVRVAGTGRLAIGSSTITLGGNYITLVWTEASDQRIGQAILDAAGAQATADGKVESFTMFAATDPEPAGLAFGDLLFRLYTNPPSVDRWTGTAWAPIATYGATAAQEAAISAALTSAANAQAVADGKIDTFYQTSMPSGSEGDLWFDVDDGNKLYRHNGSTFVEVQDDAIANAISAAAGAQSTADGKVTTFIGESTPTAEGVGDLWYKASTQVLSRWSGAAWVATATSGAPIGTNVGGTPATTVETGANAANNGVNIDGTIKTGKVETGSAATNAFTAPWYIESSSALSTSDGVEVTWLERPFTKAVAESTVKLFGSVNIVAANNAEATIRLKIYSADGSTLLGQRGWRFNAQGLTILRIGLSYSGFFSSLAAGSYLARLTVQRFGSPGITGEYFNSLEVWDHKR